MLSAGEWIRNKRFLGLRNNLSTDISPVFNSVKQPGVGTTFSVGSVKNLRTTGVSRIRNVASDRTSLIALRAGTYLSKSERSGMPHLTATTVNSLCGCQNGTVEKVGLCPTCRKL
jgi:hypothetical protein